MSFLDQEQYKWLALAEGIVIAILAVMYFSVAGKFFAPSPQTKIDAELNEKNNLITTLNYDLTKAKDMHVLARAVSEFKDKQKSIPENWKALKDAGYLNEAQNVVDPETGKIYYYKKIENDFVFCVYLSDAVWGVNTEQCPPN